MTPAPAPEHPKPTKSRSLIKIGVMKGCLRYDHPMQPESAASGFAVDTGQARGNPIVTCGWHSTTIVAAVTSLAGRRRPVKWWESG